MYRIALHISTAIVAILFALTSTSVHAQSATDSLIDMNRTSSTMIGLGSTLQWDTYLSNERYRGPSLTLLSQKSRSTHWMKRRLFVQHLTYGNLSYCKPRSDKHKTISGFFHWQVAWQYHFIDTTPNWEINAGAGLQSNLGFVYNTLGGNNPASARASLHIISSLQAIRHFNISRHRFSLTTQADIPLSGIMFSPDYGQSYYEIFSLGQYSHNICYANPFRAFQANILLTLDWHLKTYTSIRLGYNGQFMQSYCNNIKTQDLSNYIIIGYVRKF